MLPSNKHFFSKLTATAFKRRFEELLLTQPRYNLKQVQAENSDYSDTAVKSKNCYYCFGAFYCEDVYYGRYSRKCCDCSGITFCVSCEQCIECTDCIEGYCLTYCRDCFSCNNCDFCEECYSCKDCFGCIGLYRKQYCLFNKQLTKEEFTKWQTHYDWQNELARAQTQAQLEILRQSTPRLALHNFRTDNCVGNHLAECADCYGCFDSFALEDCFYALETNGNKSCCDLTVCFEAELCYNCIHSPFNYNCNFLLHVDRSADSEFCAYSRNLKNCFGCVYLTDKEYHILNTPVDPSQYSLLVKKLKEQLIAEGLYDLRLYFISGYEKSRLANEVDPVVNLMPLETHPEENT